jgi:hypothetical protein
VHIVITCLVLIIEKTEKYCTELNYVLCEPDGFAAFLSEIVFNQKFSRLPIGATLSHAKTLSKI